MVTVKEDMKLVGVREEDTEDRVRRRHMIGCGKRRDFFWPLIFNICASEAEAGVKLSHLRTFSIRKSGNPHTQQSAKDPVWRGSSGAGGGGGLTVLTVVFNSASCSPKYNHVK